MIESLYFENNKREMYSDSVEGLTPRKKIRVRNYPRTQDLKLYLETKISSVEGRYKIRTIIDETKFKSNLSIIILLISYATTLKAFFILNFILLIPFLIFFKISLK